MFSRYEDYRQGVVEELRAVFDGREGFLYHLLRYHLGWVDQQGVHRMRILSCTSKGPWL